MVNLFHPCLDLIISRDLLKLQLLQISREVGITIETLDYRKEILLNQIANNMKSEKLKKIIIQAKNSQSNFNLATIEHNKNLCRCMCNGNSKSD